MTILTVLFFVLRKLYVVFSKVSNWIVNNINLIAWSLTLTQTETIFTCCVNTVYLLFFCVETENENVNVDLYHKREERQLTVSPLWAGGVKMVRVWTDTWPLKPSYERSTAVGPSHPSEIYPRHKTLKRCSQNSPVVCLPPAPTLLYASCFQAKYTMTTFTLVSFHVNISPAWTKYL
jgi:hypothetical protein